MTDLNLIRTFVAVCEEGSVTAAAARLSQPKSTVSRHLARLEEVMARPLLERDRSGVALTPEGKRLFEKAQTSIHMLEPLAKPLRRVPAGGRVRVQAPRYFARGPMAQVVLDFMRAEPDVTVELHGENRLADTQAAGMDLVVHVGMRDVQGEMPGRWDRWQRGFTRRRHCSGRNLCPQRLRPCQATRFCRCAARPACPSA